MIIGMQKLGLNEKEASYLCQAGGQYMTLTLTLVAL